MPIVVITTGNTALSYQLSWEDKLGSAMINAERSGGIIVACHYAQTLLKFIGVTEKEFPDRPLVDTRKSAEVFNLYLDYYFKLLDILAIRINATLAEVRSKYRGKNTDIPSVEKSNG